MHLKSLKQLGFVLLSFASATNLRSPKNLILNGGFETTNCDKTGNYANCKYSGLVANQQISPWKLEAVGLLMF